MGGNAQLPLDYVVLVRPEAYLLLGQQDRYAVARQIGRLNKILKDRSTLLMGPGAVGDDDAESGGVPVGFADICHATVLTELTYPEGGISARNCPMAPTSLPTWSSPASSMSPSMTWITPNSTRS